MRAEHARICALAFFDGWGGRQKRAADEVAADLSVPLVGYDDMQEAARQFGSSLPDSLLPEAAVRAKGAQAGWLRRLFA